MPVFVMFSTSCRAFQGITGQGTFVLMFVGFSLFFTLNDEMCWVGGRGGVLNTSNLNVHQWERDPEFVLLGLYIGCAN